MTSAEPDLRPLWRAFSQRRVGEGNLNDHLDLPAVLKFIDPGDGRSALDLGCGLGQSSFKLAELFDYSVVAVDIDDEMLAMAQKLYSGTKIRWVQASFDKLAFRPESFSLIVSCLSFHFVPNLGQLLKSCAEWLALDGKLIFSVRHPIRTSNPVGQVWADGAIGWTVANYFAHGLREFSWLDQKCINFHRPLSTYFRLVRECGFEIEGIEEPTISHLAEFEFGMESQSVPFFLTIACRKRAMP